MGLQDGIVVSIRAKIEGWQAELAKILAAAKKVDLGSSFGKDLTKSYNDLEKQVESMTRSMKTRLTSDTGIDGFLEKISAIDESFKTIGNTISNINLSSINTDYLKNNFGELIEEINLAKELLAIDWDAEFLKGIASGTKLGNLLEKLLLDPKLLNIDNIGDVIGSLVEIFEKRVKDGSKTLDEMRQKLKELLLERDRYLSATPINDIKLIATNVIGTPDMYGLTAVINTEALDTFINEVTSKLNSLGDSVKGKREEIDKSLSELGKATTVDELREKLEALLKVGRESGIRGLGLGKLVDSYKKNISIIKTDSTKLEEGIRGFKERLLSYGVSDEDIAKLVPEVRTDVWESKFGKIQLIVERVLLNTKTSISELLPEILKLIEALEGEKTLTGSIKNAMSTLMSNTNTLNLIDKCVNWITELREKMSQSTKELSDRVTALEERLLNEATEEFRGIGSGITADAAAALRENAAAALEYKERLAEVLAQELMVGKLQGVVLRWFSIYAAIRMVRQGINSVIETISELDKTITEIAIVTDMDLSELWSLMPKYTEMARQYAASISGVYEVSLLYYQQGLGQEDVMALTEETLKMARISGLDYAEATDYMTNAIRSFKMEMTDALRVVDVYSSVAASSATNVTELATAMSKTASSAEAVGSSFENTTAMMAVMIEATRESAENIGSAMKSIISRYGEMTSDPSKLIDSEGLEMSLNRVDKALLTIGVTLHDTNGEFRNFDDVIMELAEKWDTVDKNTLRYIATIMAGNRQQSRFLALVSSYDRLKELSKEAADSEDAAQQLYLKTLDSIAAKLQLLLTSILDIYTSSGVLDFYKWILDVGNNIVVTFDLLSAKMGVGMAIGKIAASFTLMATLVKTVFESIKFKFNSTLHEMELTSKLTVANEVAATTAAEARKAEARVNSAQQAVELALLTQLTMGNILNGETRETVEAKALEVLVTALANAEIANSNAARTALALEQINAEKLAYLDMVALKQKMSKIGMLFSAGGLLTSTIAAGIDVNENRGLKAGLTGLGSVLSGIGTGFMIGGSVGGIVGTLSALPGIIEAIGMAYESAEEKMKRLQEAEEEANNKRIKTNLEYKTLKNDIDELLELAKARYDSADAMLAYIDKANEIAENNPDIISSYSVENGAIVDLEAAYIKLGEARKAAGEAAEDAAGKSIDIALESKRLAYAAYGLAARMAIGQKDTTYKVDDVTYTAAMFPDALDNWIVGENNKELPYLSEFVNLLKLTYNDSSNEAIGEYGLDIELRKNLLGDIDALIDSNDSKLQLLGNSLKAFVIDLYSDISEERIKAERENNKFELAQKVAISEHTRNFVDELAFNAKYFQGASVDYLTEFDLALDIINKYVFELFTTLLKDIPSLKMSDYLESDKGIQAYNDIVEKLQSFWNGLGDSLEEVEKLIANRGKYTKKDFENKLIELAHLNDEENPVLQKLLEFYSDSFNIDDFEKAITSRLNDRSNKKTGLKIKSIQPLGDTFASDELSDLLVKYDTLQKLVDTNILGFSEGQTILDKYIEVFSSTNNEEVLSLLTSLDVTSFSSVLEIILLLSDVTKFDLSEILPTIEALTLLSHLIAINVNTEALSILKKISEGISDFLTSVKNASKGMDFKAYLSEIEKYDFKAADFEFKNGKYYAKDYNTYVNTLTEKLIGGNYEKLKKELKFRKIDDLTLDPSKTAAAVTKISNMNKDLYKKFFEGYYEWIQLLNRDSNTSALIEYYYEELIKLLEEAAGEGREYATDIVARSALESGLVELFAKLVYGEAWDKYKNQLQDIISAISSGNISGLTDKLRAFLEQYSELIISTYESILKNIASSLFDAFNGGDNRILVTETNLTELSKLKGKNWISGELKVGEYALIAVEELEKNEQEFIEYVFSTYHTEAEKLSALKQRHQHLYENNRAISLNKIADLLVINYDEFVSYLESTGFKAEDFDTTEKFKSILSSKGLAMNAAGEVVVKDVEVWILDLTQQLAQLGIDATEAEKNAIKLKINLARNYQSSLNVNAIKNILTNYQSVSDEMITALADSLKLSRASILKYFSDNGNGTYTTDVSSIISDILNGTLLVSEKAANLLSKTVQETVTNYLNSLLNELDNVGKSSNFAEVAGRAAGLWLKMSDALRAIYKSVENLYEYDAEFGYRLKSEAELIGLEIDKKTAKAEIERKAKLSREYINNYLFNDQANRDDISKFILNQTEEDQNMLLGLAVSKSLGADYNLLIKEVQNKLREESEQLDLYYILTTRDKIRAYDFESIIKGTKNETLAKADIRTYLSLSIRDIKDLTDDNINTIYKELLDNNWDAWNSLVKDEFTFNNLFGQTKEREFSKANYDLYKNAFDEAKNATTTDIFEPATLALYDLLRKESGQAATYTIEQFLKDLDSRMKGMNYDTSSSLNERREALLTKEGVGKASAFFEMIKNGSFKESDLVNYFDTYLLGIANIEDYYDFTNHKFIGKGNNLAEAWNFDELTGELKLVVDNARDSIELVWSETATALGTTIDIGTQAAKDSIDSIIENAESTLNKLDSDLILVNEIKSIVGDTGKWQSMYNLPDEIKNGIKNITDGVKTNNDLLYITSESGRLAVINLLNSNKTLFNATENSKAIQEIEVAKNEMDTKYDLGANVLKLLSGSVDTETARIIAFIKGQGETLEAINNYMESLGYKYSTTTGYYEHLGKDFNELGTLVNEVNDKYENTEFVNNINASFHNMKASVDLINKQYAALDALISNREEVTYDQIKDLANSLGDNISPEDIIDQWFSKGIKPDTYRFNWSLFKTDINDGKITNWQDTVIERLAPKIASMYTDILNSVSSAATDAFTGTNDHEAMKKFKLEYERILGPAPENLYSWDSLTKTWKLSLEEFNKYKNKKIEELGDDQAAKDLVEALTTRVAASAVDISSFINANNRDVKSIAYKTFLNQLKNYYSQIGETFTPKKLAKKIAMFDLGGSGAVEEAKKIAASAGIELTDDDIQAIYAPAVNRLINFRDALSSLAVGQYIASNELREILSSEDVGMVDAKTGLVTSVENLALAYLAIYERMTSIAEGGAATLQQKNDTYAKYLNAQEQEEVQAISVLGNAMGMTYEEFANILTNNGKELKDVINQSETFGITQLGNGKIRILDFTKFATLMGWNPESEEYLSAFKTYNDSLISLNRATEKSIKDEITSITSAKGGDWLNLTYLSDALNEIITKSVVLTVSGYLNDTKTERINTTALDDLNTQLVLFGARIENGILKISEDANLLGIALTISSVASTAGIELSSELAAIADAVLEVLKSYVDAITNGIKGGLNNAGKTDLISKAANLGITNLNFEKTADGFKLALKSAIELYNAISKVDALLGKLVFDELSSSLLENNENFATTTALLNHITTLRKELTSIDSNISDARRLEYEAELQLALLIAAVRSTTEDNSWNFMSNKIPGGQNNPLNYAKNWTLALTALSNAWKTSTVKKNGKAGFLDYTSFYNIVTELNNMAGLMDEPIKVGEKVKGQAFELNGSLESASELIQAGCDALTTVDTGEVMVNLGDLGIKLENGASDMETGITHGILSIAKSQMEMLDGLISMLELVVAMEQLGDITGEDTKIDLGDIFAVTDEGEATENIEKMSGFTKKFKESRKKLVEYLEENTDAKKIFENTKMNLGNERRSMYDMMTMGFDDLFPSTLSLEQKASAVKSYQGLLDGLYLAAISGNYDLDNIAGSLQEILNSTGYKFDESFTLDVGDITFVVLNGVVVKAADWSDKLVKEVLAKYKKLYGSEDGAKEKIIAAILDYLNGKSNKEVSVEDVIRVRHTTLIKKDSKGEYIISSEDGKTKYYKGKDIGFDSMIAKTILEDLLGVDGTKIELDLSGDNEGGAHTTVTYGVTTKTKFIVKTDKEGNTTWISEDGSTGSTQQELLENIYKKTLKQGEQFTMEGFEQWVYMKYGVHLKIKPVVTKTGANGDPDSVIDDPTKDPEVRRAIEDAIANKKWTILNDGKNNGVVEIELTNGVKVKLNKEDITVGGTLDDKLIAELLASTLGFDITLGETIALSITNALSGDKGLGISTALGTAIALALTSSGIPLDNLKITPESVSVDGNTVTITNPIETATGTVTKLIITATTVEGETTISGAEIIGQLDGKPIKVKIDKDGAKADVDEIEKTIKALSPLHTEIEIIKPSTSPITEAINELGKPLIEVEIVPLLTGILGKLFGGKTKATGNLGSEATGTVGMAKAQGTLMGELGPELVVSKGRYFVAGLNGPEMVNLADDAIVFNHLQTKSLLEKGMSSGRGRAVTNELKAVSFAKGNVNGGPAMASASAALAALKQLRAQWASLAQLSAKDLAGKGGGGGGGGDNKAFIKELEKWYNWLLKIALLEKDINYYEQERNTIMSQFAPNGKDYYNSLLKSIAALKEELAITKDLYESLKKYFEERRAEMNSKNNPFTALYTFDENGQLLYKDGALAKLSAISGRNNEGKPNMTPEEQYKAIIAMNPDFANFMKYDSSGNEIKSGDYSAMVQAFWDKIDSDKEEMLSLHDSIEEYESKMLELELKQNEIMKELRDNLIDVEKKVYDTVVDIKLRAIDELLDTRDAIEAANNKLITGLTNALTKELDMYNTAENQRDLDKLQAQLAILLRSGGSASEISSLLEEIADKQLEMYFDARLQEIDALLEASDKQLEKLDALITLQTELLEYLKKYGLLWNEVYTVMLGSPEEIANYIKNNNSTYWNMSLANLKLEMSDLIFKTELWTEYRDKVIGDTDSIWSYLNELKKKTTTDDKKKDDKKDEDKKDEGTGEDGTGDDEGTGGVKGTGEYKREPISGDTIYHNKLEKLTDGTWKVLNKEKHRFTANKCTLCGYTTSKEPPKKKPLINPENPEDELHAVYGNGGINDEPGLAMLHGTKNKPEAVFNPEQTRILRKNILSNNPNSLVSLLQSYNDAYKGLSSNAYNSISNSSNTSIGKAEINMNIDKLANDYDAKQAARTTMNEILRIALKTSANNSLGR